MAKTANNGSAYTAGDEKVCAVISLLASTTDSMHIIVLMVGAWWSSMHFCSPDYKNPAGHITSYTKEKQT